MCKLFRSNKKAKQSKSNNPKPSSGSIKDFVAQRHGCLSYPECYSDPVKKAEVDADLKSYLGYH